MTRASTIGQTRRLLGVLGLSAGLALMPVDAGGQLAEPAGLPGLRDLSAALAEPASRPDALLTLIALSRLLESNLLTDARAEPGLVEAFREDRAWLDRLAARYSQLTIRSTILDPAAWFIQQELGQHQIHPSHDIMPLGPGFSSLTRQLFDRSDERLAAVFLPAALFHVEVQAVAIWQAFQMQVAANPGVAEAASVLHADWFDPWMAAEPPAPERGREGDRPIDSAMARLQLKMYTLTLPEPPDALRTRRLRFDLYAAMPALQSDEARTAAHVLRLATAMEGLHEGRFLQFIQILLWTVTDLLDVHSHEPDTEASLPRALVDFLPRLSATVSQQFNEIDPRFNANIAAAFDVARELADGALRADRLPRLQLELADAVAQMVLLAPDLAFYFDQPVRRRVSEEIDICVSVAVARDESGRLSLTRRQFDGCLNSMVALVDDQLRSAELAGEPSGPYGPGQLRRELELMPWQRINYLLGYLHELAPVTCPAPEQPLPNSLEWAALATLLSWFAAESPVFVQTPQSEALVSRMEQHGTRLMHTMSRQIDCISGSGSGLNDPVSESLSRYRAVLDELVRGIRKAEIAFREARLKPGADVVLSGAVTQRTAYRTPGLAIRPCVAEKICEMNQPLEATRALIGLFPDEYLVADQTGLGTVEICYDDVAWIDRRAEPVRPEEPGVANFYGRLSFRLLGRYREGARVENVFGSQFASPDEYHYLIAANEQEVLDDVCPTEWIGRQIVTSRGEDGGFRLVPDRLTYLASARSRPSEVILSNWSRGAEWRDWFVTGIGVKPLEFESDAGLRDRLAGHLRALYQAEQQAVYSGLLRPAARSAAPADVSLNALLTEVTTYKTVLRALLVLFYPEAMLDSDEIRSMMEGQNGLLDESVIRRFRSSNFPVGEIHDAGIARLQRFQTIWSRQPEIVLRSGSVAASVAHAMARLGLLQRAYFTAPAPAPSEPLELIELPE